MSGIIEDKNMKKNIAYKAPEGKLLRIEAQVDDFTIQTIKITGDFFIHPEDDLIKIEKILPGKRISQVKQAVDEFTDKNQTRIIGFTSADLQEALEKIFPKNPEN
ncbi:MAG: lipoate protein ligase C-terminal domain-containing protein [Patescibacteria group bacterium]